MRVHIVQKGDTLWKIAKQYAVGFEELKRLNAHLTNPDYIVPGMEIYLPDAVHSKEKEVKQNTVVKEQARQVKEAPVIPAKEVPVAPVAPPVVQPKPIWQGDLYFQQAPQPMPMPMPQPMPSLQHTHVHFQPTIEQSVVAPAQQPVQMPMPQMMPQQPIIIQQPAPQPAPQPIFIEQPVMQPMHHMQPMQPIHQPMPICPYCHGIKVEHPAQMQPLNIEESSDVQVKPCNDRQQQVENYYDNIQQMMCMPQPCCHPMMPYPMQMMPQMHPMHQPRSWH